MKSIDERPAPAEIAAFIGQWERRELAASNFDRNKALDNLEAARAGLLDPARPDYYLGKSRSHADRMGKWLEGLESSESTSDRDAFSARITFGALMNLSGAARKERIVCSTDQYDYMTRKGRQFSTLNSFIRLKRKATERLALLECFETKEDPPLTEFRAQGLEVIERSLETDQMVVEVARRDPSLLGKPTGPLVEANKRLKDHWSSFAVSSMYIAALIHQGDWSQVPVLEPKSISDSPAVLYPFAEDFSWSSA